MIGGIIDSFVIGTDSVITFQVRDIDKQNEFISVKAKIPNGAQQLIEIGKNIWWQGEFVYLELCDVIDNKFPKIGYSYNHRFVAKGQ